MQDWIRPEDFKFKNRWRLRRWKKIVPWLQHKQYPFRNEFFWRYRWAKKYCSGLDVLDIPCGMGWGSSLLKNKCKSLVGMDINIEAIEEAKRRYSHLATFLIGNMKNLTFLDNSFDIVICFEGIEHVDLDTGCLFIEEAYRVLNSNGYLLLSSPHCINGEHSGNPYHLHEYRPNEIYEMITRKFVIKEVIERIVDNRVSVHYFRAEKRGAS